MNSFDLHLRLLVRMAHYPRLRMRAEERAQELDACPSGAWRGMRLAFQEALRESPTGSSHEPLQTGE